MGTAELKRYVWKGMAAAYRLSGAARARRRGTVAILTYHRVLSAEDLAANIVQPGMYVRDDVFRMHMDYLCEEFEVVSLAELLERWKTGRWDRQTACCVITFDDGWLDNYKHAFPILKNRKLPATIFLPTDFIGTTRWFWPEQLGYLLRAAEAPSRRSEQRAEFYAALEAELRAASGRKDTSSSNGTAGPGTSDRLIEACKTLDISRIERLLSKLAGILGEAIPATRVLMNWDEVREMSRAGISFGSHSCSHHLLDLLPNSDVRHEVAGSYERLCGNEVNVVPVFCYPNGNYNAGVQQAVKESGYEAAVSCHTGVEREVPSDWFALRRISLHHDISDTPSLLNLALSGLR